MTDRGVNEPNLSVSKATLLSRLHRWAIFVKKFSCTLIFTRWRARDHWSCDIICLFNLFVIIPGVCELFCSALKLLSANRYQFNAFFPNSASTTKIINSLSLSVSSGSLTLNDSDSVDNLQKHIEALYTLEQ